MKKVILVFAMVAVPVFFAQPAIAAEGDAPAVAAVEAPPPETAVQEQAEVSDVDPPAPPPPVVEEQTSAPAAEDSAPAAEDESAPAPQAKQKVAADTAEADVVAIDAAAVDLESKVDICHVPPGNPENAHSISVSYNSIVKGEGHGKNNAAHAGDVIPSFDYVDANDDPQVYPGRNLGGDNPCAGDEVALIEVPTEDPFLVDPTCTADGFVEVPDSEGVIYTITPSNTPGDVDVDATAEDGYIIDDQATIHWDFLVLEQLSGLELCPVITDDPPDSVDVDFCHATASFNNPYVDPDSATAGVANGHDAQHNGPIFNGVDAGWGDIIEPYFYNGDYYPGQNWTAEGQAVFANGCNPVNAVVPVLPSATDPTCDVDGTLIVPEDTDEITYSQDPAGTGPNDYVITATATLGNFIVGQTEFPITVLGQLSADDPACVTPGGTDPEDEVDAGTEPEDDAVLPDTGGSPLWMVFLAGAMMAAGSILLMRRQPAASTPSAGPAFFSLVL
ncbi:MAG: LPXTG cell wall anchor domain-containing protein, partial [Aeromicrobium sp.]